MGTVVDAVTVNEPSSGDFDKDSSSVANENGAPENDANTTLPAGPLAGFRQRRAERVAAREEQRKKAQEQQKKITDAIPERLLEQESSSLRANRISVTVIKDGTTSYGLGLAEIPKTNNLVKIDALVKDGLLYGSPIRRGDVLKSVNNEAVKNYRSVMMKLMKANGRVTISVDTPASQSNPAMVQAFCRKPSPDTQLGIEFEVVEHSTTQNNVCADPNGTQEIAMSKLLQVKSIEPDGLFAHSVLSPGDFVLTIDGTACTEMDADEAATILRESESIVNITALNPKLAQEFCSASPVQRWMRRARRTGVGALGGTMVGLGMVMIPLPFPPPFGEILVVGGVSVLGTEFEAPKRVMRNARDALQNVVESNGNDDNEVDETQQPESAENTEANAEEPVILMDANIDNMYSGKANIAPPSPKASSTRQFLKNVGRNVVLPFLDHVVGDKKGSDASGKSGSDPEDENEDSVNEGKKRRLLGLQ